MTQNEKQILLKELCARLPYGVKATTTSNRWNDIYTITGYANDRIYLDCPVYDKGDDEWLVEFVIPFLRPMSSMTKEDRQKYYNLTHQEDDDIWAKCLFDKMVDFCNEKHLDYRGLIPMGLALEAPEGMYKFNE